jgi:hypothetical protein
MAIHSHFVLFPAQRRAFKKQQTMKYSRPPIYELSIIDVLEKVKDEDKVKCVKVIIESIIEDGIIDEIRKLVNDSSYDDQP